MTKAWEPDAALKIYNPTIIRFMTLWLMATWRPCLAHSQSFQLMISISCFIRHCAGGTCKSCNPGQDEYLREYQTGKSRQGGFAIWERVDVEVGKSREGRRRRYEYRGRGASGQRRQRKRRGAAAEGKESGKRGTTSQMPSSFPKRVSA